MGQGAKGNTLTAEARKSAKTEEQREPEERSKDMLKYWATLNTQRGWWMKKTSAGEGSRDRFLYEEYREFSEQAWS